MNNRSLQIAVSFMRRSLPPLCCGHNRVRLIDRFIYLGPCLLSSIKGGVKKKHISFG